MVWNRCKDHIFGKCINSRDDEMVTMAVGKRPIISMNSRCQVEEGGIEPRGTGR